jgi:hypothetical protein
MSTPDLADEQYDGATGRLVTAEEAEESRRRLREAEAEDARQS